MSQPAPQAPHPRPTPADPGGNRDSARASLLRANTAVTVIIATILLLALAGVGLAVRATRAQSEAERARQRAVTAEDSARGELARALLAEAKATRLGQTLDRRAAVLDSIRRAAAIAPGEELRDQAVAALALPERTRVASLALDPGISTVVFDHQIQNAAIVLPDGSVSIRNLADSRETHRLRHEDGPVPTQQARVVGMDFSPDGLSLGTRYMGGAFALWDLRTGRLRFLRDADSFRRPASNPQFSSDGRQIVVPVFEPDGFAVLSADDGRTIEHYPEVGSYHHGALRPGTNQFAAYDGTRILLLAWEPRQVTTAFDPGFGVRRITWSPDGQTLAIAGNSLDIHLWNPATGQIRRLSGHRDAVYEAFFSPNGERLASRSFDGTTRIWNVREARTLDVASDRRLLRWGDEGRSGWLVAGRQIEVWRESRGSIHANAAGEPGASQGTHFDVSPDGSLAVSVADRTGLLVWDLDQLSSPALHPIPGIRSAAFDPTARRILITRDLGLESRVWSRLTNNGRPQVSLAPPEDVLSVNRGRANLVTASASGSARAFVELITGSVWAQQLSKPDDPVRMEKVLHASVGDSSSSTFGAGTISLSPDGSRLVCGADGPLGTWVFDTTTGTPLHYVDPSSGAVQFSPDGRWLVVNSVSSCRVYRTSDWSLAWERPGNQHRVLRHGNAAFSPDSRRLACAINSRQIALVDTATGHDLAILESPSGSVAVTLRWSAGPDGGVLAVATPENSIDIWHPEAIGRALSGMGLAWDKPFPQPTRATPTPAPSPDPSVTWVGLPLLLVAGTVAGVALLSLRRHRTLIHEFSRTEALALRREQELQVEREIGRLKSSFVSMVSHEFRTPLGITMSAVELLRNYRERLQPAKEAELLDDIHSSTLHMANLMEQVLLLGRVEAGKLACKPASLDLPAFLSKLVEEQHAATARKCPVLLRLPHATDGAHADDALLRHILGNLVGNAVKYSPAGNPVELEVLRDGPNAIFHIRDQGIGIPPDDLPRLFQTFQRAGNVGDVPGTGLGLVIVKRCVDLHGGSIHIDSTVGKGTTITVRLPAFPTPGA